MVALPHSHHLNLPVECEVKCEAFAEYTLLLEGVFRLFSFVMLTSIDVTT